MTDPPHKPIPIIPAVTIVVTLTVLSNCAQGDVTFSGDVNAGRVAGELSADNASASEAVVELLETGPLETRAADRLWLISTRRLTPEACQANLECPGFSVYRVNSCGSKSPSTLDHYLQSIGGRRDAVIYSHGNRLDANKALGRGLEIYRRIRCHRPDRAIDWIIFSWPATKQGTLIQDARRKARRTDAQGLYLGWLLRKHAESGVPTALIGYSFGGRVVAGALHVLAGGQLGGRQLQGPPMLGVPFDAGLVAPAIESNSMGRCGEYALATKNLDRLLLLYNRRDAVLKRYWLLDRVRGVMALGYSGPQTFALRADGTKLSLRARDCSPSIGLQHYEIDYYDKSCRAGYEMANLINDLQVTH